MYVMHFSSVILVSLTICCAGNISAQETKAKRGKPKPKSGEIETVDAFGRPEGSIANQTARYYAWYDGEQWHLRTTAKQARNFNGTIRVTNGEIKSCVGVGVKNDRQKKANTDAWRINPQRNELKFVFRTATLSDGLDFVVEGDGPIEFDLFIDTQQNPRAIFLGRSGEHPRQIPFRLPAQVERTGK